MAVGPPVGGLITAVCIIRGALPLCPVDALGAARHRRLFAFQPPKGDAMQWLALAAVMLAVACYQVGSMSVLDNMVAL